MPTIKREQIAGMNIHYLFYSLDYFLGAQEQAGIKTIELWGGAPHFYMDTNSYADCQAVKRKAAAHGLTIGAFTPESIIYPYNIAAPDPLQFQKSKLYFANAIKVTAELGAKLMTLNSGYGYLNEPQEEAWNRSAEMLSYLAGIAEQEGITIAMETLRPEESKIVTTIADAKKMFTEINSPAFKVMVDTVAMSIAGETLMQWLQTFGKDLVHLHFVDCKPYGHLAWGDGNLNPAELIQTLHDFNYQGLLGQEITEMTYYDNPAETDRKSMEYLRPYIY
ncbi:sugar phosphate isomerase/epimerase family protein [Bacillus rubiinfantis]|uniref:sugar phosphate isomerase/epimerase family protein n=1 Tax=Bacillus rubiinfantis TaxID=1499680 RepID=UPI0005AB0EA8|nr:sugar phosphate isomerase/epimerase family protein [Bacillus rubiinfantis]